MAKVPLMGFRCARCNHEWLPRDAEQAPRTCPKCKSPYWDRPRRNDVAAEYQVKSPWVANELDGTTVEYTVAKGSKEKAGVGHFSASPLGKDVFQISIIDAYDPGKSIKLIQADVDTIATHPGKYRFKCVVH